MTEKKKTTSQKLQSLLFFLLKIGVSLGILAFLVYRAAQDEETMNGLLHGKKIWSSIAFGFFFTFIAVLATIVRWWRLVRIQKMQAEFWNTLRIGYIGYLFNLAPMGIVGGDLLKAWLLTRREKTRYPNAGPVILGSMFVDRMIGLYALFMLGGIAILATGVLWNPSTSQTLRSASWAVLIAWVVGTLAWMVLLCPPLSKKEPRTPRSKLEEIFQKISSSVRLYRNYPLKLAWILLISILIHASFATSIYFLADGIWRGCICPPPTFAQHMFISPASMSMSAVPLPVGPVEVVLDELYRDVTGRSGMGLVVMLAYRFICLLIGLLGVVFYFSARDEIRQTMVER